MGLTANDKWRLRFGGFDMSPGARTDCKVEVRTVVRGGPEPVTASVDSMLEDGTIERLVRHDNRDQQVIIAILAADPDVHAAVEEELWFEATKERNELAWTSPGELAATSVFDVLWTRMEFSEAADWDLDELRGYRVWVLSFRALPFARAENETFVEALLAGGGADTQINACDATTGWTLTEGTSLAIDTTRKYEGTGSLRILPNGAEYERISGGFYKITSRVTVSRAVSLNLTTTPFVTCKVDTRYGTGVTVTAKVDGVTAPLVGSTNLPDEWTVFAFYSADSSATTVEFTITKSWQGFFVNFPASTPYDVPPADTYIRIDDIRRSPTSPSGSTTGRETLRVIEIDGSARTPASLAIEHETAGLGKVLVYTNPALGPGSGYSPELRRWRTSGSSETANTSEAPVSGKYCDLSDTTPEVFAYPADSLPRGPYLLVGLASQTSASPFKDVLVTYETLLPGGVAVGTRTVRNRDVQTIAGYAVLADLSLPITDVPDGSSAQVRISVLNGLGSGLSALRYDDMFLVALNDGAALSVRDCGGTGTPVLGSADNRLWLESASLARPTPAIWAGTKTAKGDAYHAGDSVGSWMPHQFQPPYTMVFVANTGGANPAVSARYYERAPFHIRSRSA